MRKYMYSLLGLKKQFGIPSLIGARWHELYKQLSFNLNTVIKYYQHTDKYMASSHLLERILIANPISLELPIKAFSELVDNVALRLAQSAGLTTIRQVGTSTSGVMYSKEITEFYFGHVSEYDPFKSEKNWESLQPIEVLYHPRTDLSLLPLTGEKITPEDGYAVIAVDIPLLLIQFRGYVKHMEEFYNRSGVSGYNRGSFLLKYPLTNALKSHYDIAILNRMYNRLHKVVNTEATRKHPFALTDWSKRLDQFQDEHIKLLLERSYDIDSVMFNIPLISNSSMQEVMKLPDIVPTRQILWLLVISRIKFIRMVLELSSEKSLMRDTKELAIIKRKINQYRTDNSFKSFLPMYLYQNLEMDFNSLIAIIDKIETE